MCLSMDDKTYVDGGKVPEPDTSKLTKKSEDTQADDAATESAGTVKKQGIGQIVKQLGQGMLATLGIFFFTLLFSMPLGLLVMAVRMSKIKPLQWIAKIYISIMRGTPLMLQLLVVFCTVLFVWHIDVVSISFLRGTDRIFTELCGIFCRNLPLGNPEHSGRTARSSDRNGVQPQPDIFPHPLPADGKTSDAAGYQRGNHIGKGYIPCLCSCLHGNVYNGKTDRSITGFLDAIVCRWCILLHL